MYQEQAIEKLKNELKAFSGEPKEKAVSKPVAETLEMFCRQDDEFAQAIVENDKTLSDCCKKIMEKTGNAVSDIEVYKRAVQFYFSTADIEMTMHINLCGNLSPERHTGKVISLSLDDLFFLTADHPFGSYVRKFKNR